MGWQTRLQAAREIVWGHRWFRAALAVWFFVSGYDTFSGAISQLLPTYELIPLGSLLVGGAHLLPWWGWMLVLQGLLFASLVEYVIRNIRPGTHELQTQIGDLRTMILTLAETGPTGAILVGEDVTDRLDDITRYVRAAAMQGRVLGDWRWAVDEGEGLLSQDVDDDGEWSLRYGAWRTGMKPWLNDAEEFLPDVEDRFGGGLNVQDSEPVRAAKIVKNLKSLQWALHAALNPHLRTV